MWVCVGVDVWVGGWVGVGRCVVYNVKCQFCLFIFILQIFNFGVCIRWGAI